MGSVNRGDWDEIVSKVNVGRRTYILYNTKLELPTELKIKDLLVMEKIESRKIITKMDAKDRQNKNQILFILIHSIDQHSFLLCNFPAILPPIPNN